MFIEVDGDPQLAHEVFEQIQLWDNALKNHDIDQIIQQYDEEVSLFDVSSQLKGLEQYKNEWKKVSPYFSADMQITRRDINIHVSGDLAFLYCYTKLENLQFRGFVKMPWCRTTLCLQKKNGSWVLLHQHISMPVNMITKQAIDLEVKPKLRLIG